MSTDLPSSQRLDRFLQLMMERGASDMHLAVGQPPLLRIQGEMEAVRYRSLSEPDWAALMRPAVADDAIWQKFEAGGDLDVAYELPGKARFRVNLFKQQQGSAAVLRLIPSRIMTLTQLGLPTVVSRLCKSKRGLVLVTGPTGSGKSTTLAAMINEINETRAAHLVTIEDPIEFVHTPRQCVITQRQIGVHAQSFPEALTAAVREDPDMILVGELRDRETMSMALEAAASGLLVFATLHTNSAARTVDRLINAFPRNEQDRVRGVLADTIQAVVSQQLLPRVDGGRVAAHEIMLAGQAMGTLIRDQKTHQLTAYISGGRTRGMVSMDQSLLALADSGVVTREAAWAKAIDKSEMRRLLKLTTVDAEA